MIRLALVVFAVVVFALIAFTVIDENITRWAAGAIAAYMAASLPIPDVAVPRKVTE